MNYTEELEQMAKYELYTVSANKKYETKYGVIEEEQSYIENFSDSSKAVLKAKELFLKDEYSSIYIEFAHNSASAYWNSGTGMSPTGLNWVEYFENVLNQD